MQSREKRSKAVAWGLAMTANTPIAPDKHERELLAAFVEGALTLDEVLAQLDERARQATGGMGPDTWAKAGPAEARRQDCSESAPAGGMA